MGRTGIGSRAAALQPQMVAWRRSIHAWPELSFQELQTSRLVANVLSSLEGFRVETGVCGTGVVADLGSEGPLVALRADMDALPIEEQNEVPYRSERPGVMHACGHDAHTSMLLGAAHLLHEAYVNGTLAGRVRLIFQPAEEAADDEGKTGGKHMVEAGVLAGVSMAAALHMQPELPLGAIQTWDGYAMANSDYFRAEIVGKGGHAGYPHLAVDPTRILPGVLLALHTIASRRVSPLDSVAVSVGRIEGGSANNIIPESVVLEGTMRSYTPEARAVLEDEVRKAFQVAEAMGGAAEVDIVHGEPALHCSPVVNALMYHAVEEELSDVQILRGPFGMGGEDFAYMAEVVPAAMAFLGCGTGEQASGLHTPRFDIDERALPIGAALLAETARRGVEAFSGRSEGQQVVRGSGSAHA